MKAYIYLPVLIVISLISQFNASAQQDQNTIRSKHFLVGAVEPNSGTQNLLVNEYYDGLGRLVQTVSKQYSPDQKDVVQPMAYDGYGRVSTEYLAYPTVHETGNYKPNSLNDDYLASDHYDYYKNVSDLDDTKAYSIIDHEDYSGGRILSVENPGQDWSGKSINHSYSSNSTGDAVINFEFDVLLTGAEIPYQDNELYKSTTTDEDGNQIVEYKDKSDKVILKKVFVEADIWAHTYYIYDDFDQLRVVLPPEASDSLNTDFFAKSAAERQDFLDLWAFQYKYDGRKRMTEKRVPGSGWVYMVYDERDRLVLTQDANQRGNNEWLFTKYDVLNRPVSTGIYSFDSDYITMESTVNAFYANTAGNTDEWFEVRGSAVHGYTDQSFPKNVAASDYLTVTYYDDYSWNSDTSFDYVDSLLSHDSHGVTYYSATSENSAVKGLVTGGLTKNLDLGSWLKSITYYDDRYRPIQTITNNHILGIDVSSSLYNFQGQVLQTKTVHSNGTETVDVLRTFDYDHAGRLLSIRHKADSQPEIVLVNNEYNELGELENKGLHIANGDPPLQSIDYRYNIRGWLRSINDSGTNESAPLPKVSDLFNMELIYNTSVNGIPNN